MTLPGRPFEKVFGVLKQLAPTLLTTFGGPAGAIVGAIAKKSLGDATMSDEALDQAVTAAAQSPDGLVKIKQIEAELTKFQLDNKLEFAKVNEAHFEAENADRADARSRQVALRDTMPQQIFYVSALGFFGSFALIVTRGLPASGAEVALSMVGTLGTVFVAATAYFVGTTRSSKTKDETIASIATQP